MVKLIFNPLNYGVVPETFLYTPKQKGGITTHITLVKSRVSAVSYQQNLTEEKNLLELI